MPSGPNTLPSDSTVCFVTSPTWPPAATNEPTTPFLSASSTLPAATSTPIRGPFVSGSYTGVTVTATRLPSRSTTIGIGSPGCCRM